MSKPKTTIELDESKLPIGMVIGRYKSEADRLQRELDIALAKLAAAEADTARLHKTLKEIADDQSTKGYLRDIRGGNAELAQIALSEYAARKEGK